MHLPFRELQSYFSCLRIEFREMCGNKHFPPEKLIFDPFKSFLPKNVQFVSRSLICTTSNMIHFPAGALRQILGKD